MELAAALLAVVVWGCVVHCMEMALPVLSNSMSDNSNVSIEEFLIMHSAATDGSQQIKGMTVKGALTNVMVFEETRIHCPVSRFYRIDGKCNNLRYPRWGAAFEPFIRELPNKYDDGKLVPRLYATGNDKELLPSARAVTTGCLPSLTQETQRDLDPHHNQNLMQFGQFFSHDLGLTPVMEGFNCCMSLNAEGLHPDTFTGGPCFPIMIPENDRQFHHCMVFNRSVYVIDKEGVAQQLNSATHFIDTSNVYGSTEVFSNSIRTFKNGKLRTDGRGMLPDDNTQKCVLHKPLHGCPVAGDNRVSVFPGLTATHLVFHLEHNRVVGALKKRHPKWSDDRLFHEGRAIVIAQTQNMVYREYLPIILGRKVMKFFGLNRRTRYDPKVNPSIINAFQTAAFRFGHTQINNHFLLNPGNGSVEELKDLYFRPDKLMDAYSHEVIVDELMQSLMRRQGQRFDPKFAEGVEDFLFLNVDGPGHSTDLPARNIQRGRDHGLPGYLEFRNKTLQEFKNATFVLKLHLPDCLPGLYRSPEDMDLFLGGFFEGSVRGGVVGPVFAYLIGKQFQNLRKGDRLFFDNHGSQAGFSRAQIRSLKRTSYSGIICRTMGLSKIQKKAFKMPHVKRNPIVDCDSIPDVNFSLW